MQRDATTIFEMIPGWHSRMCKLLLDRCESTSNLMFSWEEFLREESTRIMCDIKC